MVNETPLEDYYIDAILPKIREFLRRKGFNVIPRPISRQNERFTPYDRLFETGEKLFGLQFKRPFIHNSEIFWERDEEQQSTLRRFNWIFYALPYFIEDADYDNSLHLTKILEPRKFDKPRKYYEKRLGMDWGSFITEILKCNLGFQKRESRTFFDKTDKNTERIQKFLKIIDEYGVEDIEVPKIELKAGYSYFNLMEINFEKREIGSYSYYYPNKILVEFNLSLDRL